MNIENIFPHTLAKQLWVFWVLGVFFVTKMHRKIASVIRKTHFKSSEDVSGTLLRGIKPAFVKCYFRSLY